MDLQNLAIVVWRVIGVVFLTNAVANVVVQFGAVSATFGQIMDDESLYRGSTLFAIFLWPMVLAVMGTVFILASRTLARLVVRGLDSHGR